MKVLTKKEEVEWKWREKEGVKEEGKGEGNWRVKVNYALRDLKKKVLEPAKEELLNNEKSDIWFEYTTETSKELKDK